MARLDSRDKYPSGMEDYLAFNGWHFNKKMCEWAVSKMYKINVAKRKEFITPYTKETVENLLKANNIKLDNDTGYDAVYVANMAKADFYGSSISDDMHLAKFIKDYLDDPDGYDGIVFTRFYADCIGSGTPIM
jgi:hypothetical protein